ncbi:ATP-grasp domain-containing protein [Parerythrobacter jejuensis]|uniref:Prokaryotic glutathione synthetase ATP-binding domain-containing protein n=1 Tax=Parerythrobacter jejuensis TaxID=795812 RepID=A0A845ASB9_9SPHN|nr:hypothetical protein [Parerythrobacter jejuensis]MXP31855.1 hypothetical protein [Parerythrobacter jejuensis]
MKIGFLTCPGTHPGSSTRRDDAFEHDIQVDALCPALAALGRTLVEIDWRSPMDAFEGCPVILIGTPWDYQDDEAHFLSQLDALTDHGHIVCNPADLVRWNSRKTYLRDLEQAGAATIPTVWVEHPTATDIRHALDTFDTESVVAKRQVGAGAEGQSIHHAASPDPDWRMDHPAMLQPFLPQIQQDGEYSFLFVDGAFSHALRKRPADGDYRVQSLYGGTEEPLSPSAPDLAAAQAVIDAIPLDTPLYARIDMVRGADGGLLLMEAELIEPYLYPEQGPQLASMMAAAIDRRLS